MKTHRRRLRAILAFLLNRPIKVTLPRGTGINAAFLYPDALRVIPAIEGGSGEGEEGVEGGDGSSGDGAGASEDGGDADGADGSGEGGDKGEGSGEEAEGKPEPDWKAQSRKHEREKKKARKEADELREALKKREDADKSEQEKAVDKAREEGKQEALTTAEKERRQDRLESAVTRIAAKKIEIGDGDKKRTVRYDDPEDAEVFLRRKIDRGEIEEDELFDENGKVKPDVVSGYLREILEEKPRLAEDSGAATPRTADGDADGGKGSGSGEEAESMNDRLRRK